MQVGDTVTLIVKDPMWDTRDRYTSGVIRNRTKTYTGMILANPRWLGQDHICLSTDSQAFPLPFRIIAKEDIEGLGNNPKVKPPQTTWQIPGSKKGQSYIVTRAGKQWACDCVGFGFRRHCKHVTAAIELSNKDEKSLLLSENKC
jgi:hypothetical protein